MHLNSERAVAALLAVVAGLFSSLAFAQPKNYDADMTAFLQMMSVVGKAKEAKTPDAKIALFEKALQLEGSFKSLPKSLPKGLDLPQKEEFRGEIQVGLAKALLESTKGDQSTNIERAITLLGEGTSAIKREHFADTWAEGHATLGNAYLKRVIGSKAMNLDTAISEYKLALEVYTNGFNFVAVQSNLGDAYAQKISVSPYGGEARNNAEAAAVAYQAALSEVTTKSDPEIFRRLTARLSAVRAIFGSPRN